MRGVPRLAPVLKRLRSLDNFDDAVLFRQEVANLFAGFVRKPAPDGPPQLDPLTGAPVKLDRDGFTPMVGLEPGTMQELLLVSRSSSPTRRTQATITPTSCGSS